MNNTYTLLLLTLNEIDGLKAIYPKINKNLFSKIAILDGGSTDGTIEWAKQNDIEIYIQKQKGFRHAYLIHIHTEIISLYQGFLEQIK